MGIASQLTRLVKAQNVKITHLAKETDTPLTTLYSLFRNKNKAVNLDMLQRIADYLHVPVEFFFQEDLSHEDTGIFADLGLPFDMEQNGYILPGNARLEDTTRKVIAQTSAKQLMAVRVHEHAMSPAYQLGEVILVNRLETVTIGTLGLFEYEGKSYFRILGDGYLLALNPEHVPVILQRSYTCIGRVVGKAI